MEKLCSPSCLQAVCHKFSDGVDVVKCVSGFIKEVGETEQWYSSSLEKLVRSPLYNFHSNFLTQLLGSTPYKETGTVKHTWDKLGEELNLLAKLHAEKAQAYQDSVRKPLSDLVPQLEEKRKEFKNRARQLRADLDAVEARHLKEKSTYHRMAGIVDKMVGTKPFTSTGPKAYLSLKTEARHDVKRAELNIQKGVYGEAHRKHVEARKKFDKGASDLCKDVQKLECERVNTVKACLKGFTSILSNTAPAYLEAMQRMTMSVEEISATGDIQAFVDLQLQQLGQDEEDQRVVPALDLRPLAGDSPTSTRRNGHLPGSRRSSQDEDKPGGAERDKEGRVKEEAETRREKEWMVRDTLSSRAPLAGPQEEIVGVVHNRDVSPATPPRLAGVVDTQKPPRKPRRKPPLQAKPVLPDTSSPTDTNVSAPSKPRPQAAPRITSSQLPNGHSSSHPTTSSAHENHSSHGRTSTANKACISPKTSPRSNRKHRVPSSEVHEIGHSPSSSQPNGHSSFSSEPIISPSSKHESRPLRDGQISQQQEEAEQLEVRLLGKLNARAQCNDYYSLLKVESDCSHDNLAKARRERSRELHPDHCANDEKQRLRNEEKLTLINHAYQDVLQNEVTRENYNTLCAFRKRYAHILQQDSRKLKVAEGKLAELRKRLKKAHMPEALLHEVDCAMTLIQSRLAGVQVAQRT